MNSLMTGKPQKNWKNKLHYYFPNKVNRKSDVKLLYINDKNDY